MGSIDVLMEGASLLCIMKIIPRSDFDRYNRVDRRSLLPGSPHQ